MMLVHSSSNDEYSYTRIRLRGLLHLSPGDLAAHRKMITSADAFSRQTFAQLFGRARPQHLRHLHSWRRQHEKIV